MTNWDDIKKQVREAEEPLSENAWTNMEQMLNADAPKARHRVLWFALAFTALVALFFGVSTFIGNDVNYKEKIEQEGNGEGVINDQGVNSPPQEGKKEREIVSVRKGETKTPTEDKGERLINHKGTEHLTGNNDKKRINKNANTEEYSKNTIAKNAKTEQKQLIGKLKSKSNNPQSIQTNTINSVEPNTSSENLTPNKGTFITKTVKPLPIKPIGLPRQTWSSPSPKVFSVGSPILTNAKNSNQHTFNYRWEIRAFAMATYNLAPKNYVTESPTTHIDYDKATNNAVTSGLGFDAGIELKYRVFKHFKIGGGIEYRKLTNNVNYQYETNKIPLIDSASGHIIDYFETPNTTEYTFDGSNEYTFISIPLSIYYEFPLKDKWSVGAEGIYNHSFLLSQSSIGVNPTKLTLDEQSNALYKSSLGSAQIRLSLMYQLTNNLYLAAEPSYRQYFNSFNQSENVNWTPRDLSLSLSVIYRFNNLKGNR